MPPPHQPRRGPVLNRLGLAALLVVPAGCARPSAPCPPVATPGQAGEFVTEPFQSAGNPYEWGALAVRRLDLAICTSGAPAPLLLFVPADPGDYPVVVFQHGFMTRNSDYGEVLSHLASHGFVVVAPQMYEPGLPALLGRPSAAEESKAAAAIVNWLPTGLPEALGYRPRWERLGLAGHSRGAKVAWLQLQAGSVSASAVAGVDPVDGTGGPFGNQPRVVDEPFGLDVPTLVIGTGLGGRCAPTGDNHEQFYAASDSPAWHIIVPSHGHADMLDEPAAAFAAEICPGGSERAKMRSLTAGLLTAFFRGSLQADPEAFAWLTEAAGAPLAFVVEWK